MESRQEVEAPRVKGAQNPNVFDDEYEVETPSSDPGNPMAAGLQVPGRQGGDGSDATSSATQPSSIGNASTESTMAIPSARNSIQKSRGPDGAPVLGDDRWEGHNSLDGGRQTYINRAGSTASSYAPTDRARSPVSQLQPAYPYGLYQQSTTLGRTPSMATESTARPLSITSSTLPPRPTHPYASYPQNGITEDEVAAAPAQSVPIGFPGRANEFHRRLGPDGEEQDILGPDGHSEQLPPYSRYPEEAAPKITATASASSQESRDEQVATPPSQQQSTTAIVPAETNTLQAEAGAGLSEKAWKEKTWKEKRRTKFCGGKLPCWMLTFIVVTLIVIIGLVAGLVGGLLSANNRTPTSTVITTTLYDASQIATPTGVPGPPTGAWALPLGVAQEQQTGCLLDSSQANAWTCASNGPPLLINISSNTDGGRVCGTAQLGDINPQGNYFNYGTQPPVMDVSDLEWVIDLDDPRKGPALHFQAYYDKQVLLPEDALSSDTTTKLRRAAAAYGAPPPPPPPPTLPFVAAAQFRRSQRVQTGDEPWLCYWNDTFIEGFIYVRSDSAQAAAQSSALASLAGAVASSGASATTPAPSSTYYARREVSDEYSSTPTVETVTSTPLPSEYTYVAAGSGTVKSTAYTLPTALPLFPQIIKVEERRVTPYGTQAYCVKMQLLNDGDLVPYEGPDGSMVTVTLNETDPSASSFDHDAEQVSGGYKKRRYRRMWDHTVFEVETLVRRDDEPPDSCHCQWMNS